MNLIERVQQGMTTESDAVKVAELIRLVGWARDLGDQDQPLGVGWLIAASDALEAVE